MEPRIGVVGAGIMGRNHARVIRDLGATLAGVADPDAAARKHVGDRYDVPTHATPDALIRDANIDALVIATPTVHHFDVAKAALEAGKHILVEKPLTPTVKEGEELARIARDAGLVLAVGHVERHNPVVRWVKDALDRRAVGGLIGLQSRRLSPFPDRIRDVGVVLDIAIHDLDVVSYLAGASAEGVYALAGRHRGLDVEDHASILTDFANGVDAFTEVSWLTPTKVRTLTITCEEGVIEADYMKQEIAVSRAKFGRIDPDDLSQVPVEYIVERVSLRKEEPLKNEHRDFYAAFQEGRAPLVDAAAGVAALRLCEAALLSARDRRRVAPDEVGA